jgi:hypothetical protein
LNSDLGRLTKQMIARETGQDELVDGLTTSCER